MLSATEIYPVTLGLQIVLWIEAVIYLGIGVYELFDDFIEKPQPWMTINGRVNGFVRLTHKIGAKCMLEYVCCWDLLHSTAFWKVSSRASNSS